MKIVPVSFKVACSFIEEHHRHHKKPQGHKFSIGLSLDEKLVGVAMVGRPVARMLDNGFTVEVTRLCVLDGVKNACSKLYSACWRTAKAMGHRRIITYILQTETGVSLKAAGWKCAGEAGGGSWSRKSRQRTDKYPLIKKVRYENCVSKFPFELAERIKIKSLTP